MQKVAFIIAGATGDLTKRKLIPAFESLFRSGTALSPDSVIIGTGRTPLSTDEFRSKFTIASEFKNIYYHTGITGLRSYIGKLGVFTKTIIILAIPPSSFISIAKQFRDDGFGHDTSIVLEKPIGYDLESACKINSEIENLFSKQSVYRMDHYLGKETIQNILIFRFANMLFEPVWNDRFIESIQISVTEQIGVEKRGNYFDDTGILRDFVQNHILQMLALLTMESPSAFTSSNLQTEKEKIFSQLEAIDCCKFQYSDYQSEKDIRPDSKTETFACMKMRLKSQRWQNTSIFVRAGKALHRAGTEIGVRFKKPDINLFGKENLRPDTIIFKIQPNEGIILDIQTKTFGRGIGIRSGRLSYCFDDHRNIQQPEGAYEKLFRDLIEGNDLFFVGAKETEMCWRVLSTLLPNVTTHTYVKGEECPTCLSGIDWIEFDDYALYCSI